MASDKVGNDPATIAGAGNNDGTGHGTDTERRRFFRIDDTVKVSYRILGQDEAEFFAARSRGKDAQATMFSDYDKRIVDIIDQQRDDAPQLAELAGLLNKKINSLLGQMRLQDEALQKLSARLRQVNISACGVAFEIDEDIPRGKTVSLDLELQPKELTITTLAKVISCASTTTAGRYFLRLDYDNINAADQELLVSHIMARQPTQQDA